MTSEVTKALDPKLVEQVVLGGDLSKLSPEQRLAYYSKVCESLGLNPLTKPFEFIILNGKLTMYARRDATEQLRKIHGISIEEMASETLSEDVFVVRVKGRDRTGRTDMASGAVSISGLKGENKANALLKAETKAKRRLTLSMCGLGMLDETEVASIPGAVELPQVAPKPAKSKEEHYLDRIAACASVDGLRTLCSELRADGLATDPTLSAAVLERKAKLEAAPPPAPLPPQPDPPKATIAADTAGALVGAPAVIKPGKREFPAAVKAAIEKTEPRSVGECLAILTSHVSRLGSERFAGLVTQYGGRLREENYGLELPRLRFLAAAVIDAGRLVDSTK